MQTQFMSPDNVGSMAATNDGSAKATKDSLVQKGWAGGFVASRIKNLSDHKEGKKENPWREPAARRGVQHKTDGRENLYFLKKTRLPWKVLYLFIKWDGHRKTEVLTQCHGTPDFEKVVSRSDSPRVPTSHHNRLRLFPDFFSSANERVFYSGRNGKKWEGRRQKTMEECDGEYSAGIRVILKAVTWVETIKSLIPRKAVEASFLLSSIAARLVHSEGFPHWSTPCHQGRL